MIFRQCRNHNWGWGNQTGGGEGRHCRDWLHYDIWLVDLHRLNFFMEIRKLKLLHKITRTFHCCSW